METQRQKHEIEVLFRAVQPVVHLQGSEGNIGIIARSKVQQPDGSFAEIPHISGNSIRHSLREVGSLAMLEAADLLGPWLPENALRLLFAGGMVAGAGKPVKIAEWRELVRLLPHLSLLGGCVGNRVREGSLTCDYARLVCEESLHVLPQWVGEWLEEQGRVAPPECDHLETVQQVRMDPTLRPSRQALLSPGAREDVEHRLLKSENASELDDDRAKLASKSTMLPYEFQAVVSGSLWYWRVTATTTSEIESDALGVMLAAWLTNPRVGGKRNGGHGLLEVAHVRGQLRRVDTSSPDTLTSEGIRSPEIARYIAHVRENKDAIREALEAVVA